MSSIRQVVDAQLGHPHYIDHAAPIWRALDEYDLQGTLFVPDFLVSYCWRRYGLEAQPDYEKAPGHDWLLVAGFEDQQVTHHPNIIYLEHGIGQSYSNRRPGYTGGADRERWKLVLAPSQRVASAHPAGQAVGCAKLDRWVGRARSLRQPVPVIAISWHWDGTHVSPEASTAWYDFKDTVLPGIMNWCCDNDVALIGHAHPRIANEIAPVYAAMGIPFMAEFEEVLARADAYICDNSSTIFEFAATGRPVALMHATSYRRQVEHGMRFWEWADIGPTIYEFSDVPAVMDALLEEPDWQQRRREEIVAECYTNLGQATPVCTRAIAEVLERG